MEGTHGELGSRFADGLRGDDTDRFAEFDGASACQVAAIAHDANAAFGFTGQHGADLHTLNTSELDGNGEFLGDFLVDVHNHAALVVLDALEGDASSDTVTQRFDDLTGFNDRADVDAVDRTAVLFGDDHVLCNIH